MAVPLGTVALFNAVLFATRGQMERLLSHADGMPVIICVEPLTLRICAEPLTLRLLYNLSACCPVLQILLRIEAGRFPCECGLHGMHISNDNVVQDGQLLAAKHWGPSLGRVTSIGGGPDGSGNGRGRGSQLSGLSHGAHQVPVASTRRQGAGQVMRNSNLFSAASATPHAAVGSDAGPP